MNISTRIAGLIAMLKFDNRWQLVFNRLIFKSRVDIYYLRGCKFLVDYDGGDATGTRNCLTSNMYRQYLSKMNLGKSIGLLDIGANGGGFPILLKVEGYDIGELVCVEMNPNTFSRLQYNMYTNFRRNSACINAALTGTNGTIELSLGEGSTGDSIYQEKGTANSNRETFVLDTVTLNHLLSTRFTKSLDIVKIDVEGAEYDVFMGEGCDLIAKTRYLLLEIHYNPTFDAKMLVDKIVSYGFQEVLAYEKTNDGIYLFANTNIKNE